MARGIQTRIEAWICDAAAVLADQLEGQLVDQHGSVNAAGEEIAMALGITTRAAEKYVTVGRAMNRHLLVLGEEMHSGTVSLEKAWTIVDAIGQDTAHQVAMAVEDVVVPRAQHRTTTELRRDVARALIEVDPEAADERADAAAARRYVSRPRQEADGMASMRLTLPALDAVTLDRALDAAASAAIARQDPRTRGQLRADTLTDWAAGLLTDGWTTPALSLPDGTTTESYRIGPVPSAIKVTIPFEVIARALPGWNPQVSPAELHGRGLPMDEFAVDVNAFDAGTCPSPRTSLPPTVTPVHESANVSQRSGDGHSRTSARPGAGSDHVLQNGHLAPINPPPGSKRRPSGAPAAGGTSDPPIRGRTREPGPSRPFPPGAGRTEAAWLEGYGPIAPAVAMLLAAGGTWRRIVTDSMTGEPLDMGRQVYRPPAHIAEAVLQRDTVCARPGCSAPARRCNLDHIVEWHEGGETSLANLTPLCSRCHRIKSLKGGREGAYEPDGSRTWETITGTLRTRLPERLPRAFTTAPVSASGGPASGPSEPSPGAAQPDDDLPPF